MVRESTFPTTPPIVNKIGDASFFSGVPVLGVLVPVRGKERRPFPSRRPPQSPRTDRSPARRRRRVSPRRHACPLSPRRRSGTDRAATAHRSLLRPSVARAARALPVCRRCRRSVLPSVCLMRVCVVCARAVCARRESHPCPQPRARVRRAPPPPPPPPPAPPLSPSRPSRCSCLHCLVREWMCDPVRV